jgi:predicted transcriptional regulator
MPKKGGHLSMSEADEYIQSLFQEFQSMPGGAYIHHLTGEICTQDEMNQYVAIKFQKKLNKDYKTPAEYGIELDVALVKAKKTVIKKHNFDGGEFNMAYRFKMEGLIKMQLDIHEKVVFYVLRDFITYPSNAIQINDKIPSFPELETIVGFKERTIRKALKSLEDKGLVKLVQSGHKKAIYVNPSYYAGGKDVCPDTLAMFGLELGYVQKMNK